MKQTLSGGGFHSLFISNDLTVYGCGSNLSGQIGELNEGNDNLLPYLIDVPAKICSVSAGYKHSLLLDTEGSVWGIGCSLYGQLGFWGTTSTPTKIENLPTIQAIQCSPTGYSLFLDTQGNVWGCGKNSVGELGIEKHNYERMPIKFANMPKITSMVAANFQALFTDEAGKVWGCGSNAFGQLGGIPVNAAGYHKPVLLEGFPLPITSVAAGKAHSLYLDIDGHVWSSGNSAGGQLGINISRGHCAQQPQKLESLPKIVEISAGGSRTALLDETGQVWTSGRVDGFVSNTPIRAPALSQIQTMSCTAECHSLYLEDDGSVLVAGVNKNGQLGMGDIVPRLTHAKNPNLPAINNPRLNFYSSKSARNVI